MEESKLRCSGTIVVGSLALHKRIIIHAQLETWFWCARYFNSLKANDRLMTFTDKSTHYSVIFPPYGEEFYSKRYKYNTDILRNIGVDEGGGKAHGTAMKMERKKKNNKTFQQEKQMQKRLRHHCTLVHFSILVRVCLRLCLHPILPYNFFPAFKET